jgi:GH15 family glucan-1,4-alpha-glucosidase
LPFSRPVSAQGAMDWLCWPRFDSPALFAALLDADRGGYWRISPCAYDRVERTYLGESNIFQTRFLSPSGTTVLTDLMPLPTMYSGFLPAHEIIRIVECAKGEVDLEVAFLPRAKYGLESLRINDSGGLRLRIECSRGSYWLRSTARLQNFGESAMARVPMHTGETLRFSLSYAEEAPAVLLSLDQTVSERIASSARWWQQWARQADYDGPHRDAVVRSASQHTHSRLLCWSALDRLISLYRKGLLAGARVDRYHEQSELIRREIQQFAWNRDRKSYVSVLNTAQLDASILLVSWYGFEEAASECMQSTHRSIREGLGTSNGVSLPRDTGGGGFRPVQFLASGIPGPRRRPCTRPRRFSKTCCATLTI